MFSSLFSATFCQILPFYGLQFFPAMENFLGPLLSYLAENSAIWQQCYVLDKEGGGEEVQTLVPLPDTAFCNTKLLALVEAHG
jgi:hypothetical protein